MKHIKLKLNVIAGEIFQFTLITYFLLLLIEALQPGFVSYFFNFNILSLVLLASGIIMWKTHTEQIKTLTAQHKLTGKDILYTVLIAVIGAALVFYNTQLLGWIAFVIAILFGGVIILLSFLIFME